MVSPHEPTKALAKSRLQALFSPFFPVLMTKALLTREKKLSLSNKTADLQIVDAERYSTAPLERPGDEHRIGADLLRREREREQIDIERATYIERSPI